MHKHSNNSPFPIHFVTKLKTDTVVFLVLHKYKICLMFCFLTNMYSYKYKILQLFSGGPKRANIMRCLEFTKTKKISCQ